MYDHTVPTRAVGHWFRDKCQWVCSLIYTLFPACCCAINSSSSNRRYARRFKETPEENQEMMSGKPFGRETEDPGKFHSVPISITLPDVCVQAMQSESSPCQKVSSTESMGYHLFSCFFVPRDTTLYISFAKYYFFSHFFFLSTKKKNCFSGISRIFSVF